MTDDMTPYNADHRYHKGEQREEADDQRAKP
jgi:hypothetical protein